MKEVHILMVDDHPAILSILSILSISCTADELPAQLQEHNTELNSLDGGGSGVSIEVPIKG